jgi:hypothetical protein
MIHFKQKEGKIEAGSTIFILNCIKSLGNFTFVNKVILKWK